MNKASRQKRYILTVKPKEYLKQGLSSCGLYSIKGILSAFELDDKESPYDYYSSYLSQKLNLTYGKDYFTTILKKYAINSVLKYAEKLPTQSKLNILKNMLAENLPVMIRIGNGYYSDDSYNPVLAKLLPHWITIWGYDDDKGLFYVYDSALSEKYWQNLPAGNTTRKYSEILRDWNFGKIQPWSWLVTGPHNYAYIEIERIK